MHENLKTRKKREVGGGRDGERERDTETETDRQERGGRGEEKIDEGFTFDAQQEREGTVRLTD